MSSQLGKHLFTFAVVSDSHVNEAEAESASPYASNKLSNGRFRAVVAALNRADVAFTVHLGDMANPLPELPTYEPAAGEFKAIAGALRSPLHLTAGNHCIGDKPTGWVPVPRVCEASLKQYERIFGRQVYSFDRGPCRFFVLSSLLVNSGGERELAQAEWLERQLERAARDSRRIWWMMHYPLYVAAPGEPGSYDNVDEPGRSWLLGLLERYNVEAACSGHVHNYFYNRHGGTDLYTVPATSFVRQDYGELYSVAPGDEEGGRDDRAKLGYCLVKVYERGHVNTIVRTYGATLGAGAVAGASEPIETFHARERRLAPVAAEMRENWLSRQALMTNNSVSPFTRREARNDWSVLALEEMGISRVRLFLDELRKSDVPERMADLRARGFELVVYSYGLPRPNEHDLVRKHRHLISAWELVIGLEQIDDIVRGDTRLARTDGIPPLYLNEVIDIRRGQIDDANVRHVANYGFQPGDQRRIARLAQSEAITSAFQGFVFRLRRRGQQSISPWTAIHEISRMGRESGLRHQVHVLFSGNVTAERFVDDGRAACRVAEAAFASLAVDNIDVCFDTFEDSDRGYFVRHGLVDRRYNPRLAAKVLRHLNAAWAGFRSQDVVGRFTADLGSGRWLAVRTPAGVFGLVLPDPCCTLVELELAEVRGASSAALLDLASGTAIRARAEIRGSRLRFEEPVAVERPLVVSAIRAR